MCERHKKLQCCLYLIYADAYRAFFASVLTNKKRFRFCFAKNYAI